MGLSVRQQEKVYKGRGRDMEGERVVTDAVMVWCTRLAECPLHLETKRRREDRKRGINPERRRHKTKHPAGPKTNIGTHTHTLKAVQCE